MMNYINGRNSALAEDDDNVRITLAGAAIGNGWIDPYYQYAAAEAAYGKGIIDLAQVNALNEKEKQCQQDIEKGNYRSSVCFQLLDSITGNSYGKEFQYKVSPYNVQVTEPKGQERTFPPGHKVVETYLGGWPLANDGTLATEVSKKVLEVIHATAAGEAGQKYLECTDPPYNALAHQDGLGVVPDVVAVLEHEDQIRLLFFNGIEDLICNHVGNEKLLENLPWSGRDNWIESKRYAWKAESESVTQVTGFMKEYENLLFLKLLRSGHMVPLDLPSQSLDMIRTFVQHENFDMSVQNIKSSKRKAGEDCPACDTCADCEVCPPFQEECKECEVCPSPNVTSASNESTVPGDVASAQEGGKLSTGLILGVGALVAAALLTFVLVFQRSNRRRGRKGDHSPAPQFDLEMRDSSYTDVPDLS
jgi:hypothetical protein